VAGLGLATMRVRIFLAYWPWFSPSEQVELDVLSGGRFPLGLGVSGPQLSEGWYGVPCGSDRARVVRTLAEATR
jgi:alkanesulfonate monooxygenase SsuD/methylene tetrahydromethanopterin reductase-like flavin-dependent oxidoreductase (luciferase family)